MAYGTKYTYSDTTTAVRDVVNEFDLVSWNSFPTLKLIGGGSEERPTLNTLSETCNATKYEWLELTDPVLATTLTADVTATTSTSIAVATADVTALADGMILLIGTEQLLVTSAFTGANPVPVSRGFAGTTAATAASSSATITVIGRVHLQGADAPTDYNQYPTAPFNYVQELGATIDLTEMEQAINRYGIDNAVEFETSNKMRHLFTMLNRGLFYQTKVAPAAGVAGVFGGFDDFIPAANIKAATTDGSTTALTTTIFHDAMQNVYNAVGPAQMPDTVVCNAWVRRKLSIIFGTTNITTFREQSDRAGGVKVDKLITDFGEIGVLLDPHCPPTSAYLLNSPKLGIGPLEGMPFKREMMAKTGSRDKWFIYGAYTLQVRASKTHGKIKNISVSA
jgi:hypothetical protein